MILFFIVNKSTENKIHTFEITATVVWSRYMNRYAFDTQQLLNLFVCTVQPQSRSRSRPKHFSPTSSQYAIIFLSFFSVCFNILLLFFSIWLRSFDVPTIIHGQTDRQTYSIHVHKCRCRCHSYCGVKHTLTHKESEAMWIAKGTY